MRSLSLESILVNKNMKLLIVLIALLVRTNPSLSMPTSKLPLIFSEVLDDLREIQKELVKLTPNKLKQLLTEFNHADQIQTPRNIKNPCECEALFVEQLKIALNLVEQVLPLDQIYNILDSLMNLHLPKKSSDSCNFTTHKMRDASLKNMTHDYIQFIENWNAKCETKKHKSN